MEQKRSVGGKQIGIVIAVILAAIAIFVWPVGLLMPGDKPAVESGVDDSTLLTGTVGVNALGEYTNGTHVVKNHKVFPVVVAANQTQPILPVTVSEAPAADQTADDGADQLVPESKPKTEGKTIKMSVFKDWVSDELSIQDSDISEFVVFADKTAVEDFVKGYSWNDKFDFQWNCDVLGIDIANDYGEADPAPAVFGTTGTSGNIYFVALSSDGITPDYFQLDSNKDSKPEIIEKKSGKKTVLAVDDWSTDAL